MSGVTTTGSTILNGLDQAPPGILMWRSLLSFMGGLGVIALGLFLLPFLNIGGVSYFKIKSSDIEDRPFERFQTFTLSLIGIYATLVFTCAVCYAAAGMEGFHAINHAMSTVATGGFSTHDTSFLRYADNPAILWIGSLFMFIGSLPFSIMILFAIRGRFDALRDPQFRVFAGYCIVFAVAVAIYLRVKLGLPFFDALTHSTFNFMSIISTAGFASDDYTLWGPFAVACIFVATFLGGCSGSTTGGIKAYRFLILFELLANGVRRLIYPNTVLPVRYGDRTVADDMQRAVVPVHRLVLRPVGHRHRSARRRGAGLHNRGQRFSDFPHQCRPRPWPDHRPGRQFLVASRRGQMDMFGGHAARAARDPCGPGNFHAHLLGAIEQARSAAILAFAQHYPSVSRSRPHFEWYRLANAFIRRSGEILRYSSIVLAVWPGKVLHVHWSVIRIAAMAVVLSGCLSQQTSEMLTTSSVDVPVTAISGNHAVFITSTRQKAER